jgi:mannose-6-phosphate isomerase-like protein (cupin superfamily)
VKSDLRELADLLAQRACGGRPYFEFLRSDALSVGLYVLDVGEADRQQPHGEDEIYVVMNGRSRFSAGDEARDLSPGSVIFVAAGVAHRFHDITERLELIVVFAPPES